MEEVLKTDRPDGEILATDEGKEVTSPEAQPAKVPYVDFNKFVIMAGYYAGVNDKGHAFEGPAGQSLYVPNTPEYATINEALNTSHIGSLISIEFLGRNDKENRYLFEVKKLS